MIATESKINDLREIVPTILDTNIVRTLHHAILVDLEHLTDLAAAAQFGSYEISLDRPSAHGGRIVADHENFYRFGAAFQHVCRPQISIAELAERLLHSGALSSVVYLRNKRVEVFPKNVTW